VEESEKRLETTGTEYWIGKDVEGSGCGLILCVCLWGMGPRELRLQIPVCNGTCLKGEKFRYLAVSKGKDHRWQFCVICPSRDLFRLQRSVLFALL
jgi:hypothetical protein